MTSRVLAGWRPILLAFSIWFAHFLVCWAAAEVWPRQGVAHVVAWVATAAAASGLALHAWRVQRAGGAGELGRWNRRFAHGALAIAGAAVLFTAVPSLLLVP